MVGGRFGPVGAAPQQKAEAVLEAHFGVAVFNDHPPGFVAEADGPPLAVQPQTGVAGCRFIAPGNVRHLGEVQEAA